MSEAEILLLRRRARAEKSLNDVAMAAFHRKALDAMQDPSEGEQVRLRASQQVDRWERESLCHMRYVNEWRRILALPASAVPAAILREDDEGVALRQNSPFGFLVRGDAP